MLPFGRSSGAESKAEAARTSGVLFNLIMSEPERLLASAAPQSAEIIIIGGGAIGCGVAYALAKAGKTDILLLERADDVGQVTTSPGAGLCGQARDSAERIKMAKHSVDPSR